MAPSTKTSLNTSTQVFGVHYPKHHRFDCRSDHPTMTGQITTKTDQIA